MPFRLRNALTTFQKVAAKTFKEYLNKFMHVFFDNFNVYGNKKDHLGQLQKCLEECRQNGMSFNPKKYTFYVNSGVLLGHIVYSDGFINGSHKDYCNH